MLAHLVKLGYITVAKFDGRKRWLETGGAGWNKSSGQSGTKVPYNKYYNKNTSSSIDKEVYNSAGQKFDFKKALKDVGVSEEVAAAWMLVRHNKRATNSEIAFSRILEEVNKACKAGLVSSPDAAIRRAVEDSWSGFKADWLQRERRGTAPRRESAFEQNLRAQDATDYSRYLDELNAAHQRERDAAADKQNEFDNALKIYQATGQITGALADYLGGGSTYAGAASTYTGGGGGYGGGSYRGSSSGNAPTAADKARGEEIDSILNNYRTSKITGEPLTDKNGNKFALISSWDDYQRLKELSGATDAELNQAGISYPYPTMTDENGNTAPAVRYTTPSGLAVTWEQDDLIGGNYQTAAQTFETMRLGGATKDEVLKEIKDWYNSGDLKQSDYMALYKKYRQMDGSDFGTQAAATTPSTSGRATGTGTVKAGTRTPGAATATTSTPATAAQTVDAVTGAAPVVSTPAYDWRGIPWAQSPDNPANQKSTTSTKNTSTSAAPLFPVIDGVTGAAPSVSKPSNTSGGTSSGSLLTQLGNALKNALQLSGQMTQTAPGAGINPAGASASGSKSTSSSSSGKRTSGTSVNANGFSHSSGSIGGSGATKSTSTTVKSASTSSPVSTLTSILNNVKPGSTLSSKSTSSKSTSSKSTSSKSSGTTTKKTTTTGGGKYASRGAR
jgi:hypothetical protein